ncbi:MAG: xanthine dehydrogenase small subunit [Pseudomonadota bacterium]
MSTKPESTLRFLLDGEIVELDNVPPTRTVLEWLREDLGRTGTKEGCAEGDCGACTVVVAEPSGDTLRYRAVNACIQFLGTLHGKELITVESLSENGRLHAVQQAMIDNHGSQCGFCTPGFIMALFALYKQKPAPTRTDIDIALSGNLCRCTGYRPIVDAAQAMGRTAALDTPSRHADQSATGSSHDRSISATLKALSTTETLALSNRDGRFFAPSTLAELTQLLADHPGATILAGGTDVGLWVTKHYQTLPTIIYTGRVRELTDIRISDDCLDIGAAASLTDAFAALDTEYPELSELWRRFSSPLIRNAGTLGGNIANGSPIGDSMPALLALGTRLTLTSASGTREIDLADLYLGYQDKAFKPGEVLARILVPRRTDLSVLHSYKLSKRYDQDISAVCAAIALRLDDSRIVSARLGFGGMAAIPSRAVNAENALIGECWTEATVRKAMAALSDDFTPISDMRASAEYRLESAAALLYRAWLDSTQPDIPTNVYDYHNDASL